MKNPFVALCLLLLFVPVLLLSTGCDKMTAEEVVSKVLYSYLKVETYSVTENMTATVEIIGGDLPGTRLTSENSTGIISIENRRFEKEVFQNEQHQRLMPNTQTYIKQYLVDEWLYIKRDILNYEDPEHENIWVKLDLGQEDLNRNDRIWKDHNPLGQQIELLNTAEQVTFVRSEKLDGKDTYVLNVRPDWQVLTDWLPHQPPWQGPDWYDLPDLSKSLSYRLWVDKHTYRIVKIEINMEYGLTYFTSSESTIILKGTILFDKYNEPFEIILPKEAKKAIRGPIS